MNAGGTDYADLNSSRMKIREDLSQRLSSTPYLISSLPPI